MAKVIVECADPNDPKAVADAVEEMVGKCNITYFRQAEALKEAGKVKSDREAARKIAADTGETVPTVRHRIQKGGIEVAQGGPPIQPQSNPISKPTPEVVVKPIPISNPVLTKQDKTFILNQAKAIKTERRKERVHVREQQKQEVIQKTPPLDGDKYRLILSEFQNVEIEDGSVDAIITDPPYGFEYLPLYKDFSGFASRVLKPNAPCIVMIGQSWLELALKQLSTSLNYVWTFAFLTPGASVQVFGRKIKSNWKPVIFMVNGKNECEHMGDIIESSGRDKTVHDWGQNEEGMSHIIKRFTIKGDTVLDPFCGAGTTGVAAIKLERHFIGIDNDEYAIKKTGERLL